MDALKKETSAAKTISVIMLLTLVGKVLGLYRDRLLAVHYSTGPAASAFFTASRVPRVFFDAVFASAIAACFIPVFSEYLERKGRKEAQRFAGAFLTVIVLLTGGLTLVGMLFPQPMVALFADYGQPQTTALAVSLTRVMFPTVLFSGVAFSLVGILQVQDHFTAPALMSAVSNLVIIAYFFTLDKSLGIYGLAGAYLLGWFLQGAIQIPPLRRLGFRFQPGLDLKSQGMKRVFLLMGPVIVSTWVQPINQAINARFGSRLYDGAGVAALEYSSNLYLVIAGVFILSITNVIFPKLSRLTAGGREGEFQDTIRQTLRVSLFFVLPMSAGLMAVARPLISLIYGGGQFDAFSTGITATSLRWMSLGMAGYALQNILSRAYFAKQQGRAPLIAGATAILVNLLLCQILADRFSVAGLALAGAAAATVYALLLLLPLQRGKDRLLNGKAVLDLCEMALAAAAMGLCVWKLQGVLVPRLPGGKKGELLVLGLCALGGVVLYFLLALAFRVEEARLILAMARRPGGTEREGLAPNPKKGGQAMEQVKDVLEASWLCRALMALCLWFGDQWRASGVVRWFLHPGEWSRAASENSLFYRLWLRVRGGLCWLYDRLRLERLFSGSVFLHCWLWCAASAALAPLLPTMAALGLVLISFASLALVLVSRKERALSYAPMNKYLLLFCGVYLTATFLSVTPRGSLQPGVLFVCFTLFALVVENALVSRRAILFFTQALVVSAAAVALIGIAQYLLGVAGEASWLDSDMFTGVTTRVYSTLQNPNMLAEYLVLILPLGGALLLSTRSNGTRLWWLACCGVITLSLLLTLSRGGWLGALIAGVIFVLVLQPRLILLAPVALAALYFLLPDSIIARFTSIGNLGDSSTSYRVSIWMGSLAMVKDYWLCGIGPGTEAFNLVYPAYGYAAANAQHSHNLLIQLVSDASVWALLLFLMAVLAFTRQLCVSVSRCGDWRARLFPAAALAGVMGFLAQGMTDYSFYNYRVTLVFWAVMGLGVAWARLAVEEVPRT